MVKKEDLFNTKDDEMGQGLENMDELIDSITDRVVDQLKQRGVIDKIAEAASASVDQLRSSDQKDLQDVGSTPTAEAEKNGISAPFDESKLAGMIDHTLLNPDATEAQLIQLCEEAKQYGFAAVCVYSAHIHVAAGQLKNSPVKPIAVVDFPKGEGPSQAKAAEAQQAIRAGAKEIDMVIHVGALKAKNYGYVYRDIEAVVAAAKPHIVKVIIETAKLDNVEKIAACTLAKAAGAAFVKTSTGFGGGGATVEDVALMRRVVGPDIGVKASGGIRTKADALQMVQAGANRIGASAGIAIIRG